MYVFFLVPCIYLISAVPSECPPKYRSMSEEHSYCKPKNEQCEILKSGVSDKQIEEILKAHNKVRSKIAMGKETKSAKHKTMPSASNMMQMGWDKEIAAVAQKWTEQCNFQHDCHQCRKVEDESDVGQNLAMGLNIYPDKMKSEIDWTGKVEGFYEEVKDFADDIDNFQSLDENGKMVGHFTQVIWAESSKVGCGFVDYKKEDQTRQLYVCNYGKTGNVLGAPIYQEGEPCSECPDGTTCCTSDCDKDSYPGLCRKKEERKKKRQRKEYRNNKGKRKRKKRRKDKRQKRGEKKIVKN